MVHFPQYVIMNNKFRMHQKGRQMSNKMVSCALFGSVAHVLNQRIAGDDRPLGYGPSAKVAAAGIQGARIR